MSDNLKNKTIGNILWSAVDKSGEQVIYMTTYILLANLLVPEDYGLLAILGVFIAVSSILAESGFGSALIHKKNATEQDYCSVFYFNFFIGFFIYLILFCSAGWLARLYNEPRIVLLSRITLLTIITNSLSMVQNTQLVKKLDFKSTTKVNFFSLLISSTSAVWVAVNGYGVWALVTQTVMLSLSKALLFLFYNRWIPTLRFRLGPVKEFFPYSSRLLTGGMLNAFFNNIYAPFIRILGFPMAEVGIYTQANKLQGIPSLLISNTFSSVSFPTFVSVQEEQERLKRVVGKTVRTIALFIFPVMTGLFLTGKLLITLILPPHWYPCIEIFQILCLGGIMTPFIPVFNNLLLAKGASGMYLKGEIIRKLALVLFLIVGSFYGIKGIAFSWIASSVVSLLTLLLFTGKRASYGLPGFMGDIKIFLVSCLIMAAILYPIRFVISDLLLLLLVQCIIGVVIYVLLMKLFRSDVYEEAERLVRHKIGLR
ncbi:MAG: lipopolysaccharide biosynthesis protein [Bacteroides sp.]|nr:lipopolysaccharide biosynthesis protein [Bacteroides sp.]